MPWREDETYKELEQIVRSAGVRIEYAAVPDDSIDGPIWARSDDNLRAIMMPVEDDAFPDADTACLILGHEMGHLLTGLDSPDYPRAERRRNEAVCDLVGCTLHKLAQMIAEEKAEQELKALFVEAAKVVSGNDQV